MRRQALREYLSPVYILYRYSRSVLPEFLGNYGTLLILYWTLLILNWTALGQFWTSNGRLVPARKQWFREHRQNLSPY